ncbi:MAG TPA: hypothetical protein VGE93_01645 [Bryobacteraceae bacterium]|nr:hypothetical protein [Acidobacteriaceae bacterium]
MKHFVHFGWITIARGVLAILTSLAIVAVPDAVRTLFLLPLAVAYSIVALAVYGILDSTLVWIASFNTDALWPRIAQRFQSFLGICSGTLLLTVLFEHMQLLWFFYLMGFQLLTIAIGELVTASHLSKHHHSTWARLTGWLAAVGGLLLIVLAASYAQALTYRLIAWVLYFYLLAFGLLQCGIGALMLYITPRSHPEIS